MEFVAVNTADPNSIFATIPAGVCTRDLSGAGPLDFTLDTEASVADVIILKGALAAPLNVNLLRPITFLMAASDSPTLPVVPRTSWLKLVIDQTTGFPVTFRGEIPTEQQTPPTNPPNPPIFSPFVVILSKLGNGSNLLFSPDGVAVFAAAAPV